MVVISGTWGWRFGVARLPKEGRTRGWWEAAGERDKATYTWRRRRGGGEATRRYSWGLRLALVLMSKMLGS
ncbi:hypothetical protein NL676_023458 [Syzygium grande]|nr:hypothetical protein NL676_023458 [Syzygium grande]